MGSHLSRCSRRSLAPSVPINFFSMEKEALFNEHTHEHETFIITLIAIKCRIVEGTPERSEHSKLIWLKRENLDSLKWAPADIPAVVQLIQKK
ncbi:hypothetical protein RCG23_09415 [Neobacillus sp. PS3-34]|uniref:hypothetical protein n=1 Tax=Neobacillus sp. PS3-34 TaxID=3070678 RepID=UPI0027E07892|nr:hypothetical protein [Neobacillus sp. PS3-34]WML50037.1 hypothetical protein RCG23_09415 [Neobacillus sp. PS3-34]